MSQIMELRLRDLSIAPDNVRKTKPTKAEHEELVASIAAHGLLQNLVVTRHPGGWHVVSGGRRLEALRELGKKKAGGYTLDTPIPCRVVGDDDAIGDELGLAENTVRVAMHPADQYEAFARMADKGLDDEAIAKRFGVSVATVRQRMKLGGVSPKLLNLYRGGDKRINLQHLMAFTVAENQEQQEAVFERLAKEPWGFYPSDVRRVLTTDKAALNSPVGKYVGRKAYEKAGGTVTEDLFDETSSYFDDVELLHTLAYRKLGRMADKLVKDGWKWATAMLELDARGGRRIAPPPAEPTEDEAKELADLRETVVQLETKYGTAELTEKQAGEIEAVEQQIEKIEKAVRDRRDYTPEQKAAAGCFVFLTYQGKAEVAHGYVRPEDYEAAGIEPVEQSNHLPTKSGKAVGDEIKVRKEAGVTNLLNETLRCLRTGLVKSTLLDHPDLARDLLAFQLGRIAFGQRDYTENPLMVSGNKSETRPPGYPEHEWADESVGEGYMAEYDKELKADGDWLAAKGVVESWSLFHAKGDAYKDRVLTYAIAATVRPQTSFDDTMSHVLEAVIDEMKPQFEMVRPSTNVLWGKLSKKVLMEVLAETVGKEYAAEHSKMKAADLAAHVEDLMTNPNAHGVQPGDVAERLEAWVAPGLKAKPAK